MKRPASAYRDTLAAARRIEPEMARRVARGLRKARERVSINALAMALAAENVKAALGMLELQALRDDLAPAGTTARDAVLRGGRLGAETVNKATR